MNAPHLPVLIEIMSYDLQVAVWADRIPIQVNGRLELRNADSIPLQRFTLYLHPELSVTSVTNPDNQPIAHEAEVVVHDWSYTKSLVAHSFSLTEPLAGGDTRILQLSYQGAFSSSSLRSPSDFMRIDRKGSYLRGLGYSLWFPVADPTGIDSAALFRIQLDVPSEWMGVVFGDQERMEDSGERRLSYWSTQSPFKLLQAQLIASALEVFEGKHLSVFSMLGTSRSACKLIEFGDRLLATFADTYGSMDGVGRYYVVETCPYGCIASGNVIGLSPDVFLQLGNADIDFKTYDLIAHEFVHGFAIPLIDQEAPGAALLLEGFPSYFHVPALTEVLGNSYHDWFFRRAWLSYQEGVARQTEGGSDTSMPTDKPLLEIEVDEIPYYKDRFLLSDRFPILLDRLRGRIGSCAFLGACTDFFAEGHLRSVSIDDFFRLLETHSRQDLSGFVARWFASTDSLPNSWQESLLGD